MVEGCGCCWVVQVDTQGKTLYDLGLFWSILPSPTSSFRFRICYVLAGLVTYLLLVLYFHQRYGERPSTGNCWV